MKKLARQVVLARTHRGSRYDEGERGSAIALFQSYVEECAEGGISNAQTYIRPPITELLNFPTMALRDHGKQYGVSECTC